MKHNSFLVALPCIHREAESSFNWEFAGVQVDIGPTHNIFLSSYSDYTQGSDQWNWLQNDLQSIDRTKTPWWVSFFCNTGS